MLPLRELDVLRSGMVGMCSSASVLSSLPEKRPCLMTRWVWVGRWAAQGRASPSACAFPQLSHP